MSTTTGPTSWSNLREEADRIRVELLEHVRRWSALLHAKTVGSVPRRAVAALDALARPIRTSIVSADQDATDRERAEAAADDLWDAVAVTWSLVRTVLREDVPPLEHMIAELTRAGRYLGSFPVAVAAHDQAIDELFRETVAVAAAKD